MFRKADAFSHLQRESQVKRRSGGGAEFEFAVGVEIDFDV